MPVPLERADRKLLIVFGCGLLVVMVLIAAVTPGPAQPDLGIPSSYSAASSGAKAAYLLLKDLGYEVERWQEPPNDLLGQPEGQILILADPVLPTSAAERQALRAFLRAGGQVLSTGRRVAEVLPEGGALDHEPPKTGWKTYQAVIPSPLSRGAPEITMEPRGRWQMGYPGHAGVYSDSRNTVVASYAVGKGRVIWWAAPTPLTNVGITRPGNLNLLLNSLGPPGLRRIRWDEYYHFQRGSLWSYFAPTPIPWGLAQLGVFALAVLFTFARRNAPARAPVEESRLSPLEFVETLGDLYHRAHAAPAAVNISYQRFRYLLARRLGLSSAASIALLHQAVRDRLGWREPGLYETLQRAERGALSPSLSDAEALQIVQSLEQYAELFDLKPRTPEEKRGWRKT